MFFFRGEASVDVLFTSRLIRPAEAVLVLVGRRESGHGGIGRAPATIGTTLVFNMKTAVDDIHPTSIVKTETPCYQLTKVLVPVMRFFLFKTKVLLSEKQTLNISHFLVSF